MLMTWDVDGILAVSPSIEECKKIQNLIGKPMVSIDASGTDGVLPEIPDVEMDAPDMPRVTADAPAQLESALAALGVTDYPALRDALSSGEAVGDGSRGDAARGLQQLLVAFGQDVRVDGIVGPKTIAALKVVQGQYELPQTDKLDAEDLAALLPLLLRNGQDKPE